MIDMRNRITHNLGDLKEVNLYDDGSSEIVLVHTNPEHKITLSKEETDRLEKILKWR